MKCKPVYTTLRAGRCAVSTLASPRSRPDEASTHIGAWHQCTALVEPQRLHARARGGVRNQVALRHLVTLGVRRNWEQGVVGVVGRLAPCCGASQSQLAAALLASPLR